MTLVNFEYFIKQKKKKTLMVKPVSILSTGLMFRSKSPPLLFKLKKERKFSIHSFFCKPFKAIWLDKNKKSTKILYVQPRRVVSGKGMYLIEIPLKD